MGEGSGDLILKTASGARSLHHPSVKGKDRQKCLWNGTQSLFFLKGVTHS